MWLVALLALHPAGEITRPPARLGLNPFYQKYLDVHGIPLVSSGRVRDEALREAEFLARAMLRRVSRAARQALATSGVRIAVIAEAEVTTDIPEYADLNRVYPQTDWNKRARGLGATKVRPVISGAEENLLHLPGDRYSGESIFIHEFAHTIADFGLAKADPKFSPELTAAYTAAKRDGRWTKTYAISNESEYWAEAVQTYFEANRTASPADGLHNEIGTRQQLRAYDPAIFRLIDRSFGRNSWRYSKSARRATAVQQ